MKAIANNICIEKDLKDTVKGKPPSAKIAKELGVPFSAPSANNGSHGRGSDRENNGSNRGNQRIWGQQRCKSNRNSFLGVFNNSGNSDRGKLFEPLLESRPLFTKNPVHSWFPRVSAWGKVSSSVRCTNSTPDTSSVKFYSRGERSHKEGIKENGSEKKQQR